LTLNISETIRDRAIVITEESSTGAAVTDSDCGARYSCLH